MGEQPRAEAAMTRATEEVLRLIPQADGCVVVLVVGDQLVEACRAGTLGGPDQIRLSINESLTGLSFLSGTTLRCDDVDTNPYVDHATAVRLGVVSMVSVPLRNGIRAIGALIAASRDHAAFSEHDVETLTGAAQSLEKELAPAVRRSRYFTSPISQ
jgi:putative methionine-R-sulfoxide reductase with GAF domain